LLLLLIVLVVVLVFYDHGAAKEYGEKAFSVTTRVAHKVVNWTTNLYECGLSGCAQKATETTPASTQVASANQNQVVDNSTIPAPAPVQMPAPEMPTTPATPSPAQELAASPPALSTGEPPRTDNNPPLAPAVASPAPAHSANVYPPPFPSFNPAEPTSAPTPAPAAAQQAQPHIAPPAPASHTPSAAPLEYRANSGQAAQAPAITAPQQMPPPAMVPKTQPYQQQPQQPWFPPYASTRPDSGSAPTVNNYSSVPDGLELARNSALAGRLNESIQAYHQYLSANPNDVDAHGELGNVYFHAGRFPLAAQHYYEAATRLIDVGQIKAAADLMPVIQKYEPRLANLLDRKISHAMGGNRSNSR